MESIILNLKNLGIDTEASISRLGGNKAVYVTICKKFLNDTNYRLFMTSMEANDMNMAGIYIHTLKGVASNLGFTRMNLLCEAILADIKSNDFLYLHKKLQGLTDEYNRIIGVLKQTTNNL